MKLKITLLTLSLAAALCANAGDTYDYTFEGAANTPTTSSTSSNVTVNASAINTLTDGINTSATCLSLTTGSSYQYWWDGAYVNLPSSAATESARYIYMKVRADATTSTAFNANFELFLFNDANDLGMHLYAIPAPRFDGTWKEYCFVIPSSATFNNIRIQPIHPGTFYIDDIRLSDSAPTIPNLTSGFSCDFENSTISGSGSTGTEPVDNDWILGEMYPSSDGEYVYVDPTTSTPIATDGSTKWLRFRIGEGYNPNYSGVRYTGLYGKTTESTRYLHFKYYYTGGYYYPGDKRTTGPQSMRVFTHGGGDEAAFSSEASAQGQWNDVTIDLGVGTIVEYLEFNINGRWNDVGLDDIVLNGDPNSRNFTTQFTSTQIDPIVGERAIKYNSTDKATASTTWFGTHYKLTFPGTEISWLQTIPLGYTVTYSTTINGRTITGNCNSEANTLDLYGIKGQTSAPMTFTYTPASGTTFTEAATVPLTYFGSSEITDNGVNIGTIGTVLYKNGEAVASVPATDNKTGGYVPSYYAPMKSTSTSDDGTLSDYNNTSIVPVNGSRSIIRVSDMTAQNIYLMSPSFSDVAANAPSAGAKLQYDVSVNYAVVPHYLMVTTGPYTTADMANIVKTETGTINTLQDSWTVVGSSAPSLNLESVGKARIKAVDLSAADLYLHAQDVAVASIAGASNITNHKLVTFVANDLTPTGIEGVSADAVSIVGGEGIINITGASNAVVYDFMGRMIKSVNNQSIINVPSGLYIVKAGGKVCKVKVQ
ncbi:MAG: hypothetical protein LKF31_01640 [Muribaculaceae bacterium]|jgi:hypothetical protein|nr:hypothetical protein [Muribaculaceae bacterium]